MVNWNVVVLFGAIMFWAMLHMWSPDGRQWRTDRVQSRRPSVDTPPTLETEVAPVRGPRRP